jgi:hypothetical protein
MATLPTSCNDSRPRYFCEWCHIFQYFPSIVLSLKINVVMHGRTGECIWSMGNVYNRRSQMNWGNNLLYDTLSVYQSMDPETARWTDVHHVPDPPAREIAESKSPVVNPCWFTENTEISTEVKRLLYVLSQKAGPSSSRWYGEGPKCGIIRFFVSDTESKTCKLRGYLEKHWILLRSHRIRSRVFKFPNRWYKRYRQYRRYRGTNIIISPVSESQYESGRIKKWNVLMDFVRDYGWIVYRQFEWSDSSKSWIFHLPTIRDGAFPPDCSSRNNILSSRSNECSQILRLDLMNNMLLISDTGLNFLCQQAFGRDLTEQDIQIFSPQVIWARLTWATIATGITLCLAPTIGSRPRTFSENLLERSSSIHTEGRISSFSII